jgi:hypothetical protein
MKPAWFPVRSLATLVLLAFGAPGADLPAADKPAEPSSSTKKHTVEPAGGGEEIGLNDRLRLKVVELAADQAKFPDPTKFVLYLEDTAMGIHPEPGGVDGDTLTFFLERANTDESHKAWARVLGSPTGATRRVRVSVAYDTGPPLDSTVTKTLRIIRLDWLFWISLVGLLLGLFVFGKLAVVSNIIRDPGPKPGKGDRKTYSLGRSQMAFWFFLVLLSYLLIWLITRDQVPLPNQVLGLMGIAALTTLGGATVDTTKHTSAQAQLPNLMAQRAAARAAVAEAAALDDQIREAQATLAPSVSHGFWRDVLSDADGISLHRFQIVVWTIVLGLVFLVGVYTTLAMPVFDSSLLLLMGISAGTYIGLKIPEKAAGSRGP